MTMNSPQPLIVQHAEAATIVRKRQKGLCALRNCTTPLKRNRWATSPDGHLVGLLCETHVYTLRPGPDLDHLCAHPTSHGLEILPRAARNWKRPGMREAGDPPLSLDLTTKPAYAVPDRWFGKGGVLEVLVELQRRRCPICQRPLRFGTGQSGMVSGVHVDHGPVLWEAEEVIALRGVLCARCNGNLGKTGLHWWWWHLVRNRRDAYLSSPPAFAWEITRGLNYSGLRSLSRTGGFTPKNRKAIVDVLLNVAGDDPLKRQVATDPRWFNWQYAGTGVHALLVAQRGLSAISGRPLNPPQRRDPGSASDGATLDHTGPSHRRGPVRGLITVAENARLTYEREKSGDLLAEERAYLDDPPAQRLHITRDLCYSKAPQAWLTPTARPLPARWSATEVQARVATARRALRDWKPTTSAA